MRFPGVGRMEDGWRHADLGKPHLSGQLINMGFLLLMSGRVVAAARHSREQESWPRCAYSVDSVSGEMLGC